MPLIQASIQEVESTLAYTVTSGQLMGYMRPCLHHPTHTHTHLFGVLAQMLLLEPGYIEHSEQ